MKVSSIGYTMDAKPVFYRGTTSSLDTGFFVNHTEPLESIEIIERNRNCHWSMGELLEGHELLFLIESHCFTPHSQAQPQSADDAIAAADDRTNALDLAIGLQNHGGPEPLERAEDEGFDEAYV